MSDSGKMHLNNQEKLITKKRITRVVIIFLILQLLEFFILEAPGAFRNLNESGCFQNSSIIFLLCLLAFLRIIKSFISHYFMYVAIMNALELLLSDLDFIQLIIDFLKRIK